MKSPAPVRVRVSRYYEISPARVFDAWLDRQAIGQWMFPAEDGAATVVRLRLDARVGGVYSFVVRGPGGVINHIGTYLEIARPKRLAFTLGDDASGMSRVNIELQPAATGCELTLTHELHPQWAEAAEQEAAHWRRILDALATFLD